MQISSEELRAFEQEVIELFETKQIKGPIHLSGGNEEDLIELFSEIRKGDWIFTTYRNHYHALLAGIPPSRSVSTSPERSASRSSR